MLCRRNEEEKKKRKWDEIAPRVLMISMGRRDGFSVLIYNKIPRPAPALPFFERNQHRVLSSPSCIFQLSFYLVCTTKTR